MTTPDTGRRIREPNSLLFVSRSLTIARMARGLLEAASGGAGPRVSCVGLIDQKDHGPAASLMQEAGAVLPRGIHDLSELEGQTFDLVVTLDDEARRLCLSADPPEVRHSDSDPRAASLVQPMAPVALAPAPTERKRKLDWSAVEAALTEAGGN